MAVSQDENHLEKLQVWIKELESRLARAPQGSDDPVIIQVSVLRELHAASVAHLRKAELAA